jgi:hypothetical protein
METRKVVFPPMNAAQEAQLKSLLGKISELMGDKIETEAVITVAAVIPSDRPDILTVPNKLITGMKRPVKPVKADKVE